MKKYTLLYIACCTILMLQACSGDNDEPIPPIDNDQVTVSITTDILTTRASVTTQFSNGDKINIYAKTYDGLDAPDLVENIAGTYQGGGWTVSPEIKLSKGGKAFIYAVAPYMEELKNLSAIPVDINKQQDVLYSGSFVPVTYTTHSAKLTMKHALSLVTYNISNQGYTGAGMLQSLNLSGEGIYTQGTMNVKDGKIAGTEAGGFTIQVNKQITNSGWETTLPRMWAIPFSTKVSVVTLKARIDGKEYEARLPEVEMKRGFQYIFHLVLTNYGLEFIPDQTVIISLNQSTDRMEDLEGHGILRIMHNANAYTLPMLNGDNVFGFVNWGDGTMESYVINATHTYPGVEAKQTIIESWNSTGFELNNLVGVEEIDVSNYNLR